METLKQEYTLAKNRLSRLYDAKFDGEVSGDMFKVKETEYNDRLVDIRQKMERTEGLNPDFYEEGLQNPRTL